MGSGAIKWHVHCSVCGAFIEKSAQSDSEVECKKCRSTLEIFAWLGRVLGINQRDIGRENRSDRQ